MPKRLTVFIIALALFLAAPPAFAKANDIIRMNMDVEISKDMAVNDVVAIHGDVVVFGRVENNIVSVGGSVILKKDSIVGGEIVVIGGDVTKDASAVVSGRITQIHMPPFIPSITNFLKGGWLAVWAAVSL